MPKIEKKSIMGVILDGVNYMLPIVVAGGILLGLSYLFDDISIDPSNYGSNTPLAAFFNQIGNMTFSFMLPVFTAGMSYSIAGLDAIPAALMAGALCRDGNSSFLGALVMGFAVGYLVKGIKNLTTKLPETFSVVSTLLIIPLLSVILSGAIGLFVVETTVGYLNIMLNSALETMSGSSQVILGGILGGMQSVDMGGAVNKTAYLFATSALANGNYVLMSAVLAGALIPPYVTGLGTILFKKRYNKKEAGEGMTNLITGLAGISEGGIPFLVKDPLSVGLSCVVGSFVAGFLSVSLGCAVMAPFGGFLILPLNDNPLGFLISVVSGVAVGLIILGFTGRNRVPVSDETIEDSNEQTTGEITGEITTDTLA